MFISVSIILRAEYGGLDCLCWYVLISWLWSTVSSGWEFIGAVHRPEPPFGRHVW